MGIFAPLSHLPVKMYSRLLQIGITAIIGLILIFVFKPTGEQATFQSDLKSIRVVMDNNYPPYTFLDENGAPQGILVDQWRLWEEKTGIKVDLSTMDWGKALAEMEAGNFDVVDTIFFNEERAKLYSFSAPYTDIDVPIYFRNNISGLTDAASLKGFQIGVKAKDNAIYYLKSQGIDRFIEFESYEAIIQAARDKEILVFVVDQPPAEYFISKYGIQNEFNSSAPLYTGQFHRGVKLGDQKTLSTVENGFKLISSSEYNDIETKWYGTRINIPQYSRYIIFGAIAICCIALVLLVYNRHLQRKISERTSELNTLFSAMKDMVVVTDQNGICLDRPTNAT